MVPESVSRDWALPPNILQPGRGVHFISKAHTTGGCVKSLYKTRMVTGSGHCDQSHTHDEDGKLTGAALYNFNLQITM